METLTAEEASRDLLKLISLAHEGNSQFRIMSDEGTVILLSEETYQNLVVTLEVLSTPGLMNSLKLLKQNSN
jgi:antitoxin YefM